MATYALPSVEDFTVRLGPEAKPIATITGMKPPDQKPDLVGLALAGGGAYVGYVVLKDAFPFGGIVGALVGFIGVPALIGPYLRGAT